MSDTKTQDGIGEKAHAAFVKWFRAVYGRDWLDIANDKQDDESITARMAYESGYTTGLMDGWKWP